eukprot:TRINITY_DN4554_c0_g4_i1.p1 TRINITY_DN4554_c0_g4~~TRINITY_DN4554_c0_g4_i1.p1  ORF type:complete len:319 (+),score=46.93 TRINITY_DN4554_c0_g4_i1:449-1405(+)
MELRLRRQVKYKDGDEWDEAKEREMEGSMGVARRKRSKRDRVRMVDDLSTIRYNFPSSAFRIIGDVCIPDFSGLEEYHAFSTVNYFKTVCCIEYDEKKRIFSIFLNSVSFNQYRLPWEYVIERFTSLGRQDAKETADLLHEYCETARKEQIRLEEIKKKFNTQALKLGPAKQIEEKGIPDLPNIDTPKPACWTRRRRVAVSPYKDTMQDMLAINESLLRLLGFSFKEITDYAMQRGCPPVLSAESQQILLESAFRASMESFKTAKLPSERRFTASLETKGGNKIEVEVTMSITASDFWFFIMYEFTEVRPALHGLPHR